MQKTLPPAWLATASCARLITGHGVLRPLPSAGSIKNQLHPLTSFASPTESFAHSRCLWVIFSDPFTSDFHEVPILIAFQRARQRPLWSNQLHSRSVFRFSQPLDGFFPPNTYRPFFMPDPLPGFPFQSFARLSGQYRMTPAISPRDVELLSCRGFRPN